MTCIPSTHECVFYCCVGNVSRDELSTIIVAMDQALAECDGPCLSEVNLRVGDGQGLELLHTSSSVPSIACGPLSTTWFSPKSHLPKSSSKSGSTENETVGLKKRIDKAIGG